MKTTIKIQDVKIIDKPERIICGFSSYRGVAGCPSAYSIIRKNTVLEVKSYSDKNSNVMGFKSIIRTFETETYDNKIKKISVRFFKNACGNFEQNRNSVNCKAY